MNTTKRSLKVRRLSHLSRGIGSLICASIAFHPTYALPVARTGSLSPATTAANPLFEPVVGGSRFGKDLNFGNSTNEGLELSMPAPKPGVCRPALPSKFIKDFKNPAISLKAPILNDLGPCDSDKAARCLTMLHTSLTNHQHALVGSDESRDQLLEVNGGRLTYKKSDILTIQRVLTSWTDFTKANSINPNSNAGRLQTADEVLLQKILNRMSVQLNSSEPTMQEETEIARIHLNLSEQLAVAAEAALDPHFSDFRNAGALLASINPSASAAFSCLVGFKKSSTEITLGKKRVILGYFSGNKYAELSDASRQNAIAAALIAGGFLLVGKIIDTINEHNKMEHAEKLQKEKLAHEASEKAKDRALEREKARLPPENTGSNTSKSPTGPGSPNTTTENGKPKEEDIFKPFPGSDYDPKDNKHYDTTIGCNDGLFEALDRFDPKKHPELVTDYANPDDISGGWHGNGSDLNLGVSPEDLYTDYGNPADFYETKQNVISLDEFRKPSTNLSEECLLIRTEGGSL